MAQGTNYLWWNNIHHWDGVSDWQSYLTYSPEYFGPNALPCPEVKKGMIEKNISATLDLETHLLKGEQTYNMVAGLFIPLASGKVGLDLHMVPIEYYNMDTTIRDKRASRDYDGEGISVGDIYVSTWIRLLKESSKHPNLLVSINLRTASGNNLDGVRFTDAPGYFFDISTGKTLLPKKGFIDSFYVYGMAGFYTWQIIHEQYMQDDAFMYGVGISAMKSAFRIDGEISGYYGYIGEGDRPIVLRINLEYNINSTIATRIRLEEGIYNFPFFSLRAGVRWNFNDVLINEKHTPTTLK